MPFIKMLYQEKWVRHELLRLSLLIDLHMRAKIARVPIVLICYLLHRWFFITPRFSLACLQDSLWHLVHELSVIIAQSCIAIFFPLFVLMESVHILRLRQRLIVVHLIRCRQLFTNRRQVVLIIVISGPVLTSTVGSCARVAISFGIVSIFRIGAIAPSTLSTFIDEA